MISSNSIDDSEKRNRSDLYPSLKKDVLGTLLQKFDCQELMNTKYSIFIS